MERIEKIIPLVFRGWGGKVLLLLFVLVAYPRWLILAEVFPDPARTIEVEGAYQHARYHNRTGQYEVVVVDPQGRVHGCTCSYAESNGNCFTHTGNNEQTSRALHGKVIRLVMQRRIAFGNVCMEIAHDGHRYVSTSDSTTKYLSEKWSWLTLFWWTITMVFVGETAIRTLVIRAQRKRAG